MAYPRSISGFTLRQAEPIEIEQLFRFYQENATEASPAPSLTTIGKALKDGRLLVIESDQDGAISAVTATFDFLPEGYGAYVGELSGTCVKPSLNGCRPIGVQRLLLGVRLMNHAAYASEPLGGSTSTLITIVRDDNERSRRNVEAAGLERLATLPEWMTYEHYSWSGDVGEGWSYYVATNATVQRATAELDGLGIFSGQIRLERDDRVNGGQETIEIRCRLNDLALAQADLRAIASGLQNAGLSPPIERLVG